jgi:hypothetical protein
MVRSNWLKTLIVALAATGLTWAQQAAPPAPPGQPGPAAQQLVTIHEKDGRTQRCKVLKTWHTPAGVEAHLVQNVETGEFLTLVADAGAAGDSPGNGPVRKVAMHIFHWGTSNTSPPGGPIPPPDVVDAGPLQGATHAPAAPAGAHSPVVPVSTASMPPAAPGQAVTAPTEPGSAGPPATPGPDCTKLAPVPECCWPAQTPPGTCVCCGSYSPRAPQSPCPCGCSQGGPCGCGQGCAPCTPAGCTALFDSSGHPLPGQTCSTCTPSGSAASPRPVQKLFGHLFAKKDQDTVAVANSVQVPCPSCGGPCGHAEPPPGVGAWPPGVPGPAPAALTPAAAAPQPAQTTAGSTTPPGPAQPGDWRQSWGNTAPSGNGAPTKTGTPDKVPGSTPATDGDKTPANMMLPDTSKTPGKTPADTVKLPPLPTPPGPPAPASDATARKTTSPDLPHHNRPGPDPLDDPAAYRSPAGYGDDKPKGRADGDRLASAPLPPPGPPSEVLSRPSMPFGDASAPSPAAAPPAGSRSAQLAGSAYLPVPVVTVPDVRHPPYGPVTQVPQAPQPNRAMMMANAFTTQPPPPPPPDPEHSSGMAVNAFSEPPPPQEPGMAGAFGSSRPYMMPPGYGPMGPGGMVPPGYGYGYPAGMYAMGPYGAMGQPMYPQGGYPAGYAPMRPPAYLPPPATAAAPTSQQAGYQGAQAGACAQGAGYQVAQAQRHVTDMDDPYQFDGHLTAAQLIFKLKESLYPSQREWAAEKLSGQDAHKNNEVVPALLQAAREDPAPTVRAGCVRALARLKPNSQAVVEALRSLSNDSSPQVQHEAEEALATLAPGDKPAADPAVQRTSAPAKPAAGK